MDRFATKTDAEREDEEATHLVRPSPKIKPPRRDKRRNDLHPEDDADTEDNNSDPDMSLNYKGVTTASSVAARFLVSRIQPSSDPKEEVIQAWTKDDGKPVRITEKTLKENPSKYTDKPPKEEPKEGAPKGTPKPSEQSEGSKKDSPPTKDEKFFADASRALRDQAKNDPELDGILRDTKPGGQLDGFAKNNPNFRLDQLFKGRKFPSGIETVGDLVSAGKAKPSAGGRPNKAPEKVPESPKDKPKGDEPELDDPVVEKLLSRLETDDRLRARLGLPPKAEQKSEPKSEPKPESRSEPESEPAKDSKPTKKAPKEPSESKEPQRREVSEEEHTSILNHASRVLPKDAFQSLGALHPDDLAQVTKFYQKASASIPDGSSVQKLMEAGSKFYTLNPSKVRPPETAKNAQGEDKPWGELTSQEQDEAMTTHRNLVIARSLALREHIGNSLVRSVKAPPTLARHFSDFLLNKPENETVEQRQSRAEKMADSMFSAALSGEAEEVSDGDIKKMLKGIAKDPAAQTIAVAFLQGRDYQKARSRFLDSGSPDAITEHQSPREISLRLTEAVDFLRDQSKKYPKLTAMVRDPGDLFRKRVVEKLRLVAPEKYPAVLKRVQQDEVDEYRTNRKRWGAEHVKLTESLGKLERERERLEESSKKQLNQAQKEYDKAVEKAQKAYDRAFAKAKASPYREAPGQDLGADAFEKAMREAEKAREKALKQIEAWQKKHLGENKRQSDELAATQAIYERHEPQPPPHYEPQPGEKLHRGKPRPEDDVWGDSLKLAALRVAARFSFSTFAFGEAMDKSSHDRKAVYWGVPVDREGITPYPDWQQAHQRDLDNTALDGILRSAQDWLKVPVLSSAVDGIVRDTQLRAALDLAIRTHEDGRYSVGFHPTVYNHLLAKLAGIPDTETLTTVREASDESVYARTGENTVMRTASAQIRSFAARVAANHPELAYDLMDLASKVAQDEDKPKDKKEDDKEDGKPFPGAAKPFGEKDAQEQQAEPEKETQEQQAKQADYKALRAAVIHTAAMNPQNRAAFAPVLNLIKKLG